MLRTIYYASNYLELNMTSGREQFERQDSILSHPKFAFRYVICFLATVSFTLIFSNLHILNFTILCMTESAESNSTVGTSSNHLSFSKLEKDILFAAGYLGILPATLPIYYMLHTIGVSYSMFAVSALSGLVTFLTPLAAGYGFWPIFTMRLIQGVSVASVSPALSIITTTWSTLKGNGVYVSILAAHFQIAPLLTMPLAASLCDTLGWQWVYYIQAILTATFCILFAIFHTDNPAQNRFVSSFELRQIEKDKTHEEKHAEKTRTPVIPILKTISIWGIWITSVGGTIGFSIFLQYGPTYLNKVLHYNLSTTGWYAAIPYIFSCIARIVAQPLSANCEFLGEKMAAIVSTTISQGTMAISFIILVFIPISWSVAAQVCYTLVIVANGLNGVGITRSAQLVAKQHLSFVYTVRSFMNNSVGLFLPLLVNFIAPENTHQQWTVLFLVIFVIVLGSNIFFIVVAEVEPAYWTKGMLELDSESGQESEETTTQKKY